MRFLVDDSCDARIADYHVTQGHDAERARDYRLGLPDIGILAIALAEQRMLGTDDRDFGDLVFRQGPAHAGVIYFRLPTLLPMRLARLNKNLANHTSDLDQFLVVTERRVRVHRTDRP